MISKSNGARSRATAYHWAPNASNRDRRRPSGISEAIPGDSDIGGHSPVPAVPCRERREHLQSQSHIDRPTVFVSRDATAAGPHREPQKIPLVMSPDETKRLLAVAHNLKVRVLLSLGYGCGLRAGEVIRLKVKHIDSAQKIIRIDSFQRPQGSQRHALSRDARSVAIDAINPAGMIPEPPIDALRGRRGPYRRARSCAGDGHRPRRDYERDGCT